MKTQDKIKTVNHQHEYTGYVALMLLGEWVTPPRHIPVWGSVVSGEHSQWNSWNVSMELDNTTQAKTWEMEQ